MLIWRFFDKLEDKIRGFLSHWPILYAFYGGVGIVLFWRGVWHTTDSIAELITHGASLTAIDAFPPQFWDGPITLAIASVMLLSCGLFVSEFIGNEIIISGLRGEKKLTEKTEAEVKTETGALAAILEQMEDVMARLDAMEEKRGGGKKDSGVPVPPSRAQK